MVGHPTGYSPSRPIDRSNTGEIRGEGGSGLAPTLRGTPLRHAGG